MKCVICKNGVTAPGTVTVTLDRESGAVVFRHVPAQVCANCGEEYVDEATSGRLLSEAEKVIGGGAVIDVRDFEAA